MIPYRGRIDYCFAAKDEDHASATLDQIRDAILALGAYPEVASQQPMDEADVIPESPLHNELKMEAAMMEAALAAIAKW